MSADRWHEQVTRDAIRAGDPGAWRALFAAHHEPLSRYVRWRCGGLPDLTDDVLQEAWLTAVRRIAAFDPARGTLFDWLCGIASNAARNAVRSRLRSTKKVRALVPDDDTAAPEPTDTREQGERVARALAELPDHYEAVLRAKYLDGRSVSDIAAARGDSEKAVESLLSRARQAFRQVYGAPDD